MHDRSFSVGLTSNQKKDIDFITDYNHYKNQQTDRATFSVPDKMSIKFDLMPLSFSFNSNNSVV